MTRQEKQAFYQSKAWKNLRDYKLSLNPLCEECLTLDKLEPANEVHHDIPIEYSPENALNIENLVSLCKACHSRITIKELHQVNKKSAQVTLLNRKWNIS